MMTTTMPNSATRVYTDPRFADLSIVNDGSPVLLVMQAARGCAEARVIERVRTQEQAGAGTISEAFAGRRAAAYFAELASTLAARAERRLTESGRDFADEQVLTADRVLDMWEKAAAMPDGQEKRDMLERIRRAALQVESTAESVVDRLLG